MAVKTELEILLYIETILNNYFDNKYGVNRKIQVFVDPDSNYSLKDANGVSTPVLFVELDELLPSSYSVIGYILASDLNFSLSLLVLKTNRDFLTYKQEVQDYIQDIKTCMTSQTEKKLDITEISYSDFILENLDSSGAIIGVRTYPQQYDYSVT